MEATRLQMQNFLIFLLDLVGVTVGYFAAVWLRFGNIETGYTVMGERYVLSLAHCDRGTYDDLLSVSSESWFF